MLPLTFVVVTDVTHPESVFPHDMRCPSFRCSYPPFSPFLSFCLCLFPFVSIIVALARLFPSLPYLPFFPPGGLYYLFHMFKTLLWSFPLSPCPPCPFFPPPCLPSFPSLFLSLACYFFFLLLSFFQQNHHLKIFNFYPGKLSTSQIWNHRHPPALLIVFHLYFLIYLDYRLLYF